MTTDPPIESKTVAGDQGPAPRKPLLRRMASWRVALRLLFLLMTPALAVAWPLACATVVTAPHRPADPVTVYLIDHGRTSSLVLPTPDGALLRYVYGNWDWYALMHTGVRSGARAMLWPSQAALGRHRYPGPTDPDSVKRAFGPWSEHIYPIAVSRGKVEALEKELDAVYQQNIGSLHVNTDYELEFVKHPQPYHLFHDSNRVIAGWLEELGCEVRGPAIYANWKVKTPVEK